MNPNDNTNTNRGIPQLSNVATLEEMRRDFEIVAAQDLSVEALGYANLIKRLAELQPEITSNPMGHDYEDLYYKFRWLGLEQHEPTQIIELFQKHFALTYEIPEYVVWEKLRRRLVSLLSIEARTKLKADILSALRQNEESITDEGVIKDGVGQKGTVKNWLMDLQIALGTQPIDPIKLSDYLVSGNNTRSLSGVSRERINALIQLVEKLKLPSDTIEGYEAAVPYDNEGEVGEILGGQLVSTGKEHAKLSQELSQIDRILKGVVPAVSTPVPTTAPIATTEKKPPTKIGSQQVVELYEQNPAMRQAIADAEQKILSAIGGGKFDVRVEMGTAIAQADRARVIAMLIVLAKTQDLFTLIETDGGFRDWLRGQYGPEAENQFTKQPADPLFYSLWLQQLLEERLQMAASDAAKVGTLIANLVGRRYLKAAYLETSTGRFVWAPIRKQKDRLVFAQ
ncbi:MAG: hypothetical protein WC734_02255 [Patescibacteria group bacterium]|jgi:hypothetical protein